MPTVLLLDRSLSMMRPAALGTSSSRLDLARLGLTWFLDYLAQYFPLEYAALLTFSSYCEVAVPFTRDYESVKSKLEEIDVLDRTDLHIALSSMVEVVNQEWGTFAPCQVVVVTDGSPGVRHQDSARRSKQPLCIPFPCQISVVCMSPESEVSSSSGRSSLERLCETVGISQADVYIPKGTLNEESIRSVFTQLAKTCFLPFTMQIKCGHLSTPVGLVPSPHMLRTNFNLSVSHDQAFAPLDNKCPSVQYPNEISICGFIDNGALPAPPHYSRHFVLDPVQLGESFEMGKLERDHSKVSEESQKPSFRVLLHGGMKCEAKAALVKLG